MSQFQSPPTPRPGQPEPNQRDEQRQQEPSYQEQSGTAYPQLPLAAPTSYTQPQQYPQPSSNPLPPSVGPILPVRKQRSFGHIALWIAIGIFIGLAIGYPLGHSTANNLTTRTSTSQPVVMTSDQLTATAVAFQQTAVAVSNSWMTQTPTSQQTSTTGTANHIGDTLSNSIWQVTLNSVNTSTGANQYEQPRAGDIFLIVDITAKNLSSTSQVLSSGASFTLKDDTGQAYEETISGIGVPPDATALQPNDKLRGQISYEVPKSVHNFTFQFQDINGGTATWTFSI